jgi:hypothetical protein
MEMMMAPDEPFEIPRRMPHAEPHPREVLCEFVRKSDEAQFRCELRDHGEYGIEVQVFRDGKLVSASVFATRTFALQWADLKRAAYEKGGE